MKESTTFTYLVQTVLPPEEVEDLVKIVGYHDTARTFTVYDLLQYWTAAAFGQWESFRSGVDEAAAFSLPAVHYSTFSTKASDVPYDIFKRLFHVLIDKTNRATRRVLRLSQDLVAVDSTTMTVGKTRLTWAGFHGNRAGVKLHVQYHVNQGRPSKVEETVARQHDGPVGERLTNPDCILIEDRAYGKITRFDRFQKEEQSFVIRLKDNVQLVKPKSLKRLADQDSRIIRDITCQLGTPQTRSSKRHRVVVFRDDHGHEIRVVTDLMNLSAETIAGIYKARWEVETFFRWIKQHLNIPVLFGTTPNAVYGQLYAALITYVLLHWLYHETAPRLRCVTLSFIEFTRKLLFEELPAEAAVACSLRLRLFAKNTSKLLDNPG